jgi:predicted nuclease with TOPRIM domain
VELLKSIKLQKRRRFESKLIALSAQIEALQKATENFDESYRERVDEMADLSRRIIFKLQKNSDVMFSASIRESRFPEDPAAISAEIYLGSSWGNKESDLLLGEVALKRKADGSFKPYGTDWASYELLEWAGYGIEGLLPQIVHAVQEALVR